MNDLPSKYLIVTRDGREYPILFSGIQHSLMVPKEGFTPVSAGFFMVYEGAVVVPQIGSTSLNLSPRPQDKFILAQTLNLVETTSTSSPTST